MYFSLDLHGNRHRVQPDHAVDLEHAPRPGRRPPLRELAPPARWPIDFKTRFRAIPRDRLRSRGKPAGSNRAASVIDVWIAGTVVRGLQGLDHTRPLRGAGRDGQATPGSRAAREEPAPGAEPTTSSRSGIASSTNSSTSSRTTFRNRCAPLIAFSDFLLKDYGDKLEAEGQEFVRYLVDASRRMRAMIHGMLNLARAGKVIGEIHRWLNLDELLAVIKTDLGELFRSKGAELRIASPLPLIWGDRDRIGQLLANLISNGIKYNKSSNPWVEVNANAQAGRLAGRRGSPSPTPTSRFPSATTESGSNLSFTRRFFSFSGGFIPARNSRAREPAWPFATRSFKHTVVESGSRAPWDKGSTFFVRFRSGVVVGRRRLALPSRRVGFCYETAVSQVPADEPNAR